MHHHFNPNPLQEALGMLRDPTCDNGVQYDVVPCADYDASNQNSCAGLSGKKLKKCEKSEASGDCAGLSGKKLKKCEKKSGGGKGDKGKKDKKDKKGKKGKNAEA